MHPDEDLLSGILKNQDWALREIYKTQYNPIKRMVYAFRSTRLEPEDIFQEGLTRVILNIRAGKFRGDSSIATYLNSICRNICLKALSQPATATMPIENNPGSHEPGNDSYYELLGFINKLKKQLGGGCREIIDLRFNHQATNPEADPQVHGLSSFDGIAKKLEITAENARQRFKRCLDRLRKLVIEHPEYHTLFD